MSERALSVAWPASMALLRHTPGVLRGWLGDLPEALLDADEGAGTFSAREVVAHLIQGEQEDWLPRVRRILEHGESLAFEPFDPHGFRARGRRPIDELLSELEELRCANLAALEELALSSEDLERRGTHPEFGPVRLRELLCTWVVHDLAHLGQAARVLTRALGPDVGPWRAYFSGLRGS